MPTFFSYSLSKLLFCRYRAILFFHCRLVTFTSLKKKNSNEILYMHKNEKEEKVISYATFLSYDTCCDKKERMMTKKFIILIFFSSQCGVFFYSNKSPLLYCIQNVLMHTHILCLENVHLLALFKIVSVYFLKFFFFAVL